MSAVVKERDQRMAASSVNAQPAKSGAGGSFTWGSPLDVQDYESYAAPMQSSVRIMAAPTMVQSAPAQSFQLINNQNQFPALGRPVAAPVSGQAAAAPLGETVYWPATSAPKIVLSQDTMTRPGVAVADFGQQHPRNMMARRPQTAAPLATVDWSSEGVPGSFATRVAANPAHLSQYALAAQATSPQPLVSMSQIMQQSRPQTAPMPFYQNNRNQAFQKPVVNKQARGQGSRGNR